MVTSFLSGSLPVFDNWKDFQERTTSPLFSQLLSPAASLPSANMPPLRLWLDDPDRLQKSHHHLRDHHHNSSLKRSQKKAPTVKSDPDKTSLAELYLHPLSDHLPLSDGKGLRRPGIRNTHADPLFLFVKG